MNIGYYAHHHGSGHCRQADKLAQQLRALDASAPHCITVFTSMPITDYAFTHIDEDCVVRLPDEHEHDSDVLPGRAGEYWQPDCLHYSPVGSRNIQRRSHIILSEVDVRHIELMIVDLSVEVALLCRTSSIPYLYLRLPGVRNDTPHRNAFAGALGLIAPYPQVLESKDTPKWIQDKTLYLGFLPYQLQTMPKDDFANHIKTLVELEKKEVATHGTINNLDMSLIVTVIKGYGGHQNIDDKLPLIRELLPRAFIISLGPIQQNAEQYVDMATTVDNVAPFLQYSHLLVMACGLNAIGEACQFSTPLLVIPDERPHQEQEKMAEALMGCGRAISLEQFEKYLANQKDTAKQDIAKQDIAKQDNNIAESVLPAISPSLMSDLQTSNSADFILSIATAHGIKAWFKDWLLPHLNCKPERQIS